MKVVFEGLYNLFAPVGAKPDIYNDLSGKLYNTEAPQNTAYPYCVMEIITHDYDFMFDSETEEILIGFNLFDDKASPSNIGDYYTHLTDLYDWATPTVTGYTVVHMFREAVQLDRDDDKWQYSIQYRLRIDKN